MKRAIFLGSLLLCCLNAFGIIAWEGKHVGTVILDRWDGCSFLSGPRVDYVSEASKETLRKYAGKNVEINVTQLDQPFNPGEALFQKLTYVGPATAPADKSAGLIYDSIRLQSTFVGAQAQPPSLRLDVRNVGMENFQTDRLRIYPTLLRKVDGNPRGFAPANGPSYAVSFGHDITLGAYHSDWPVAKGYFWSCEGINNSLRSRLRVRDDPRLALPLTVKSGEALSLEIEIEVPAGEYDFLFSAAAGDYSLIGTSNLTAFDVDDKGNAKSVKVPGR
jgi:hypothetical protein